VKKAAKQFKASSSSSSASSSGSGSSGSGQSAGDDVQDTEAEVVETKLTKPKVGSQSQDNASQDDASDDKQDAGAQLPTTVTTNANSAGDKKDNMLKYIAIGGAALTGLFILSRAFQSKPDAPKVEGASSTPPQPMSGVKTKSKLKPRSSQRTRKKVMAITM